MSEKEIRQHKILNRIMAGLAIIGIFLITVIVIYFIELNKNLECLDYSVSDLPKHCQETLQQVIEGE